MNMMVMVLFILLINTVAQASLEDVEQTAFENLNYEGINLAVVLSEYLLPAGGGQTTTVTAFVTDENNQPVPGIDIGFMAQNRHEERHEQLSVRDTFTDENGRASSIYTTLAGDDNEHIFLKIAANTGDDWIDRETYVLASDDASRCEGRIINPFTGELPFHTAISIHDQDTGYYFLYEDIVNKDGFYSIAVPPGNYHISFLLDLGEENYYNGTYDGSHSRMEADNSIVLRIEMEIESNQDYIFNTEMGILKGNVSNLDSSNNLYITNRNDHRDTVIAVVNPDGSFMIAIPEGNYEICAKGGHILKESVRVEKGQVTDTGSFSR